MDRVTAEATHADAIAWAMPGGDLAATLAAGRLFAVDFSRFADETGGTVDGLQKHVDATLALYTWTGEDFVVVGIRTGADDDALVAQPGQGITWRMAKLAHLATDSQVSGLVGHFGLCHLVMEAVVLATKRCLAVRHPLRHELVPSQRQGPAHQRLRRHHGDGHGHGHGHGLLRGHWG